MKWIKLLIVATVLLVPSTLHGGEEELDRVPKPEWEVRGDQACMDYTDTQHLVRMRSQYNMFLELVPELRRETESWERTASLAMESSRVQREAYNQLFTVYTETENDLRQEVHRRVRAEQFSVFQGALPWVVLGTTAAFVGGIYIGAKL